MSTQRARYDSTLAFFAGWPRRALAVLCLVLAVVTALRTPRGGSAGPTEPVVVAARALGPGAVLGPGDVRAEQWPRSLVPATAVRAIAGAVGRPVGAPMARGEPLTAARLLDTSIVSSLAPTQVAATVRLSDFGQSAILHAGASIDLYVAAPVGVIADGREVSGAAGQAVAVGVRVLAVLPPVDRDSTANLTIVLATDRGTAARLANSPSGSFLATLRPPQ